MDKILLGLFVALVGAFLLPPMRLARLFTARRTRQATAGQGTVSEVKEQTDHVPLAPEEGSFEFRPLTAEEKNELKNPLAAKSLPRNFEHVAGWKHPWNPSVVVVPMSENTGTRMNKNPLGTNRRRAWSR